MTIPSPQPLAATAPDERRASTWLTVEGVLLILCGLAAVVFPVVAGIAIGVLFGWILIILGIAGMVSALQTKPHVHFGWSLASAILAIVAGVIIAFVPPAGTTALVLVIATWLILDGASSMMLGLHLKKAGRRGWGWPVASAIADWVLAACAIALGPLGDTALIGIIVGIDLMLGGVALLSVGRHMGRVAA
jgi:uncharacterized membrane protein HdeD (DUF308 family)